MIDHAVLSDKSVIFSEYLNESIYCLSDPTFIIPNNYSYELLYVTDKYIARPDLLSQDVYGDNGYADLLCKLNGISNPFELNEGMVLIIPSPDCIPDFRYTPDVTEFDRNVSEYEIKPIAKQKTMQRKPNEAVINDTRFRIDAVNGVVVY
jgi:hypothetical protein